MDYGIGFELYGKKLGVAGYGAIGREVAVRAKAFGMEILAYDPYMPAEKIEADGARAVDLDTMLAESDHDQHPSPGSSIYKGDCK